MSWFVFLVFSQWFYQTISLNQWFAKIGLFVDIAITYSPFFGDKFKNWCFPPNSPKILNGNFTFIAPLLNLIYFSKIFNWEIEIVSGKGSNFTQIFIWFIEVSLPPIRHFNPLCKGGYPGRQGVMKGGS